ncbi:MAG: L-threonylcarbamoyladenylate synthase [Lachnospiraceae bacterium]|nr:L-threonylcarbamoyladenylate synthase [Lachnospiraceae bacterium]
MKTKIYKINDLNENNDIIKEAGEVIRQGGLVAFPTETVYGLGGDALNPASAKRIYSAKGRPADNPLIVHLCRIGDIETIAEEIPEIFYRLAEKFWPGPLTMILKKSQRVPFSTTGGLKTVAVRMPDHQAALVLIEAAGGFVAAPSANLSGRPSPTEANHVIKDMDGRIEMILDCGKTKLGLESTILDLTGPLPEILRPGSITKLMLDSVIKTGDTCPNEIAPDQQSCTQQPCTRQPCTQQPRAPGMKYRHYAPKAQMKIITGSECDVISYINNQTEANRKAGLVTGVIAGKQTAKAYLADNVKCIGSRLDEEEIARNLYRILREFDDEITGVIYSEAFAEEGIGQAIMNRLLKAASYQIINVSE